MRDKWEKMDFGMKSIWGKHSIGGLKTYGVKRTMAHPIPVTGLTNGEAKTLK